MHPAGEEATDLSNDFFRFLRLGFSKFQYCPEIMILPTAAMSPAAGLTYRIETETAAAGKLTEPWEICLICGTI